MVAVAAAAYAVLSVARHRTLRSTGFDLGVFDQALWHAGRIEAPASTLRGLPNLLGGHFSPVLALLVPARLVGTEALLVAQALLVSAAALPIFAFSRRRIGDGAALAVAAAYLLFGGVQAAVWFDVHEVAFAPLLIALAVDQFDRGHRWASFAAALALLAVKEDLALLVIAFGLWYALSGDRRLGALTALVGIAWFAIVTGLVIPSLSGGQEYGYVRPASLHDLVAVGVATKLRTVAYLFAAFFGLALLSPLRWLTVPLLAEPLLSADPEYWTLHGHYSLTIAPVLALGAADGLRRVPHARPVAFAMVVLAVALVPAFPLVHLIEPSAYRPRPAYATAAEALARIPAGAPVTAGNRFAPHLSGRDEIRLLGPRAPRAGWVIASVRDPAADAVFPNRDLAAVQRLVRSLRPRALVAFDRGGVVVLEVPRG